MILCPSMMCADYAHLEKEIRDLETAGCDIFHCDVMDGEFVPNITMGLMDVKTIRSLTNYMIDVHLMIEHPYTKIDWFLEAGADLIYIHPEAERNTMKTLLYIRSKGKKAGIAINPDTSLDTIRELLPYVDYILIMSVFPGFAGQSFLASMDTKIQDIIEKRKEYDYQIILDGACSPSIIQEYYHKGVDGFILGTSALFQKDVPYAQSIEALRKLG